MSVRARRRLGVPALALVLLIPGLAASEAAIKLTQVFDIGGDGCIGETRVYDDATLSQQGVVAATRGASAGTRGPSEWKAVQSKLMAKPQFFLTTVGCGADRVAISIGGKSFLLDQILTEKLGAPATYYSDTLPSPRVHVERISELHAIRDPDTDCVRRFDRVRVRIEFLNSTRQVNGLSIKTCP